MSNPRVGIICDVGPTIGVGHLMRCAALAEEIQLRGWDVEFRANLVSSALALRRVEQLGCPWEEPLNGIREHVSWVQEGNLDVVVIDSYRIDPLISRELSSHSTVMVIMDGNANGQSAHIFLDQNFGAGTRLSQRGSTLAPGSTVLAAEMYALIADKFRELRRPPPRQDTFGGMQSVVLVLGGTDATGLTQTMMRAVSQSPVDIKLTVISTALATRPHEALYNSLSQDMQVVPASLALPHLLRDADAVISAAGTTLWELCCLGKPTAAIAVAPNQREGYETLVNEGIVFGLGDNSTRALPIDILTARVTEFLSDRREQDELATRAFDAIDGNGKVRVADVLLEQLALNRH